MAERLQVSGSLLGCSFMVDESRGVAGTSTPLVSLNPSLSDLSPVGLLPTFSSSLSSTPTLVTFLTMAAFFFSFCGVTCLLGNDKGRAWRGAEALSSLSEPEEKALSSGFVFDKGCMADEISQTRLRQLNVSSGRQVGPESFRCRKEMISAESD